MTTHGGNATPDGRTLRVNVMDSSMGSIRTAAMHEGFGQEEPWPPPPNASNEAYRTEMLRVDRDGMIGIEGRTSAGMESMEEGDRNIIMHGGGRSVPGGVIRDRRDEREDQLQRMRSSLEFMARELRNQSAEMYRYKASYDNALQQIDQVIQTIPPSHSELRGSMQRAFGLSEAPMPETARRMARYDLEYARLKEQYARETRVFQAELQQFRRTSDELRSQLEWHVHENNRLRCAKGLRQSSHAADGGDRASADAMQAAKEATMQAEIASLRAGIAQAQAERDSARRRVAELQQLLRLQPAAPEEAADEEEDDDDDDDYEPESGCDEEEEEAAVGAEGGGGGGAAAASSSTTSPKRKRRRVTLIGQRKKNNREKRRRQNGQSATAAPERRRRRAASAHRSVMPSSVEEAAWAEQRIAERMMMSSAEARPPPPPPSRARRERRHSEEGILLSDMDLSSAAENNAAAATFASVLVDSWLVGNNNKQ